MDDKRETNDILVEAVRLLQLADGTTDTKYKLRHNLWIIDYENWI